MRGSITTRHDYDSITTRRDYDSITTRHDYHQPSLPPDMTTPDPNINYNSVAIGGFTPPGGG